MGADLVQRAHCRRAPDFRGVIEAALAPIRELADSERIRAERADSRIDVERDRADRAEKRVGEEWARAARERAVSAR